MRTGGCENPEEIRLQWSAVEEGTENDVPSGHRAGERPWIGWLG